MSATGNPCDCSNATAVDRGGRRRMISGDGLTVSLYATFAARFTRFAVWTGTQHSDSLSRQQFSVR